VPDVAFDPSLPHLEGRRAGAPQHCSASSLRAGALCLLLLCAAVGLSGCGAAGPSEAVLQARRLFQLGEEQQAIDALQADDSAEAAYLKALGMSRLKLRDAALEQIAVAIEREPENPKYRGFQMRLQLLSGDTTQAEQLIELHAEHGATPAVALFAFYAYEGQRLEHLNDKDQQAAATSRKQALGVLSSAIVLSAEIPEFQRELLALAVKLKLGKPAESLADKLHAAVPDDPIIARQRIATFLQTRNGKRALEAARELYERENRGESAAMVYSIPLSQLAPSSEAERIFRELVERYPLNAEIAAKFAIYLTRARRSVEADQVLGRAIDRQTDPKLKERLINIAVGLPLEAGDAQQAERSLDRYRDEIADPLLITYLEGRLLFLQGKPASALVKLKEVLKSQDAQVGSNLALSNDALKWIGTILSDKAGRRKLRSVSEAIDALGQTAGEVATEEQAEGALPQGPPADESTPPPADGASSGNPGEAAEPTP
jgi:Tfp pilus assembly protein PilF